jgi:hypothetical protein
LAGRSRPMSMTCSRSSQLTLPGQEWGMTAILGTFEVKGFSRRARDWRKA